MATDELKLTPMCCCRGFAQVQQLPYSHYGDDHITLVLIC